MIVLDIETSGIDFVKCGIWQIGAIDIETGESFIQESRIGDEDAIEKGALIVTGKTEEELRNKSKQTEKQLLENFFAWVKERKIKNFICQNPQFDQSFITVKAGKYNLNIPFNKRAMDLHTLAQVVYYQKNKSFLIEEGHSAMNLSKILELCGMQDNRITLKKDKIIKSGQAHNSLKDANLEAKCFKKLLEIK